MSTSIGDQKEEYLRLLDEDHEEQIYQTFMEKHTRFIPREFVQNHGIASGLVLRKLPLGADYKPDFFYLSKSSDDWNAVFIEIKKPSAKYFRGNTEQFHSDFVNALQQITRWKAWFSSDQNKAGFLSSISVIQVPQHMAINPTYCKYVLVLGRRSEYGGNVNRMRLVRACETDDFKIITFDSLAEGLSGKYDVSIGSRHNQCIDILTDEITHPNPYSCVDPTQLRVSKTLYEKLRNAPSPTRVGPFAYGDDLTKAAQSVKVRQPTGSGTS